MTAIYSKNKIHDKKYSIKHSCDLADQGYFNMIFNYSNLRIKSIIKMESWLLFYFLFFLAMYISNTFFLASIIFWA